MTGKRVAVVVPAHNEQELIATTLAGIPEFVDRDRRRRPLARRHRRARSRSGAPGSSSSSTGEGRRRRRDRRGLPARARLRRRGRLRDGGRQPDGPRRARTLVEPVARGEVDYAKANRLFTGEAWKLIPRTRYLGNAILSLLTKIASGYWHVADSQAGYTAISRDALRQLDLERVYPRYGFPNDMLVHLNVSNARVRDFPSRPVYGVGERSGIKLRQVVPRISWLLVKGFFWRLREKYVIRDFHPLVFFYALGLLMTFAGLLLGAIEACSASGQRDHDADDRPRRAAPDLGQPVHALRDVVRHGVEQGPALVAHSD